MSKRLILTLRTASMHASRIGTGYQFRRAVHSIELQVFSNLLERRYQAYRLTNMTHLHAPTHIWTKFMYANTRNLDPVPRERWKKHQRQACCVLGSRSLFPIASREEVDLLRLIIHGIFGIVVLRFRKSWTHELATPTSSKLELREPPRLDWLLGFLCSWEWTAGVRTLVSSY